jgi:hypothetical protein
MKVGFARQKFPKLPLKYLPPNDKELDDAQRKQHLHMFQNRTHMHDEPDNSLQEAKH